MDEGGYRPEAAPEAPPPRRRRRLSRRRLWLEWLLTLAVSLVVVYGLRAEVASPYRIPSSSMEPTLHCARPGSGCEGSYSDHVLVDKLAYRFRSPHRGEIVVFRAPAKATSVCGEGGVYVKRLIGLPGEQVSEQDGTVLIDGHRLDEPYVPSGERDHETRAWPRLKADQYFLMGDNRSDSCDSRLWGPVWRRALIGPVFATYWPPGRISWH